MSATTNIEWCDSTFNPWIGCTKVSPACDDCYAARSTPARTLGVVWGSGEQRRRTAPGNWKQPEAWERGHEAFFAEHGRRRRVFCASLADVFDNEVPTAWRDELMGLIANTPHLDWLLLTKRIGNVSKMLKMEAWQHLPNAWLGATVVNQAEADRDIPKLLAVPARVRFLSIEPMLGPVDASAFMWPVCGWWRGPHSSYSEAKAAGAECGLKRQGLVSAHAQFLSWVIAGGESGPKARPSHPHWFRSLRDQCAAAGVPFLFKQHGEWVWVRDTGATEEDCDRGLWVRRDGTTHDGTECHAFSDDGTDALIWRIGKKAAGRLLDGVEHNGFPRG